MHKPRITEIEKIESETSTMFTLYFKDKIINKKATPGQFIMVWIPGLDEIPMGISHIGADNTVSITVEKVGEATEKLCGMGVGDKIGVRGPYGRGFSELGENNIVIGGGCGMAPLIPLVERALDNKRRIKIVMGSKNCDKLPFLKFFQNRLENVKEQLFISTEDGSRGIKGLATDAFLQIVSKEKVDRVYSCGPEVMLRSIYDIAVKFRLPLEASLERYIKCGIGICGSCSIGPYRVCVDGPVFSIEEMKNIEYVFGKYSRDSAGKKISLKK